MRVHLPMEILQRYSYLVAMGAVQSFRSAWHSGRGPKSSIHRSSKALKAVDAEVQHSVRRAPLEMVPVSTTAEVHDEEAR